MRQSTGEPPATTPAPRGIKVGRLQPAKKQRRVWLGAWLCLGTVMGLSRVSQYPPCGGYSDWQASAYVLPYPAGESYAVYQANCSWGGHRGVYRYSYDFLMPIGSPVTAARSGMVAETLEGFADGNPAGENWVKVRHADGTLAAYSHLQRVEVRVGQAVQAGDRLGLSGNTGQTGGVPHLHFHVAPCSEPTSCGTLPITFRNTQANPAGLQANAHYRAEVSGP